ncbi:MAG: VOC family protein [Usitatibacter sp.]
MEIRFDHLVITARTLEEGVAWVERRLGVTMGAGGKHDVMGTHNRLLGLGPGRFLEVIAIDPQASPPLQPRWFELDSPAMQARLEHGPALIHWVARTDDIEAAVSSTFASPPEILALARGTFRWKISVPADGSLPRGGIAPTMIQWFTQHPSDVLPDAGCRLEALVLHHPDAPAMLHELRFAGLSAADPVQAHHEGAGLVARIRTSKGTIELRE